MTAAPNNAPAKRRGRLVKRFGKAGIDALLITHARNVRYVTGFTGEDSAVLLTDDAAALLTDGRYTTQAAEQTEGVEILCRKGAMMPFAARQAKKRGIARLGFEPDALTVAAHTALAKAAPEVDLVATERLVEALRLRKDAAERRRIARAVDIAQRAFENIRPLVRPGQTERSVAAALEGALLRLGAEAAAFRPIVLASERAALPHGEPSERVLAPGDAVLFDWGARCEGYVSDLTRVLFIHRMSQRQKSVYTAVLAAQTAALRRVAPGRSLAELDETARDTLKRHRRNKYFTHSLGHGVGADVHEAPHVSGKSKETCRAGMVFTVEPGVYYPGRIGVRIEDMVVVTRSGHKILTTLPKRPDDVIVRPG